ncbi:MAG: alpha/beta hydrolase [Saonia sp.]
MKYQILIFTVAHFVLLSSCVNSEKKENEPEKMKNHKTEEKLKENIVFIHGFPMSASIWDSQIKALSKNYNCYAVDLPGYGSNLTHNGFNHSIDSYSDYVFQYIKENNLNPVHIVGMSMGGSITLNISRRYPDIVKSMTAIHTSAIVDTDEDKNKRDITITAIKNGGLNDFIDRFADRLLSPNASDDIRKMYISLMKEASKEVVIAGYTAIRNRPDEFKNLKKLKIPVLVIAGKDDIGSSPKEMKEMADAIPNSTFKVISDCGHVAPLEKPQELNKFLLQWFQNY